MFVKALFVFFALISASYADTIDIYYGVSDECYELVGSEYDVRYTECLELAYMVTPHPKIAYTVALNYSEGHDGVGTDYTSSLHWFHVFRSWQTCEPYYTSCEIDFGTVEELMAYTYMYGDQTLEPNVLLAAAFFEESIMKGNHYNALNMVDLYFSINRFEDAFFWSLIYDHHCPSCMEDLDIYRGVLDESVQMVVERRVESWLVKYGEYE